MTPGSVADRPRLDVALVERGFAESRQKAQALIMAGLVQVNGHRADKPGRGVAVDADIVVTQTPDHVGRGALKLGPVLGRFGVDPSGRVAMDVGASTGGFTQVLLDGGATRVYAVDVGRGQLHERLRTDPRVIARDRTNARSLTTDVVPERVQLATIDVSFISLTKILRGIAPVLADGADVVALVKPQFEVGRGEVGRGGIVRDPEKHRSCLRAVARRAQELGYAVRTAAPSPITGTEGNREFFLHLSQGDDPAPDEDLERMVDQAVNE